MAPENLTQSATATVEEIKVIPKQVTPASSGNSTFYSSKTGALVFVPVPNLIM